MVIPNPLSAIANLIESVVQREDEALEALVDKGIFFMPELAFAFEVGKEILRQRHTLFGDNAITWHREEDAGSGGPTDLIIEVENAKSIAIEFKMADRRDMYLKDVKKLLLLDPAKYERLFCAVIDTYSSVGIRDERIIWLEEAAGTGMRRLNTFVATPTHYSRYTTPISYVVCIWQVGQNLDCGISQIPGHSAY